MQARRPLRLCSDSELVQLTRSGSDAAFAEIARRYQRPLRAYCARFAGRDQAEDAVQQTMLQAAAALRRPDDRAIQLRAWLYTVARNASIDLVRRTPPDWEELDLEYDGVPQPPQIAERRDSLKRVISGINKLPDRQRRALLMREFEGRDYTEIASLMGEGEGAVRQLLFRARQRMRTAVAAILFFPFNLGSALHHGRRAGIRVGAKAAGGGHAAGIGAAGGFGAAKVTAGVAAALTIAGVTIAFDHPRRTMFPAAPAVAAAPKPAPQKRPVAVRQTVPQAPVERYRRSHAHSRAAAKSTTAAAAKPVSTRAPSPAATKPSTPVRRRSNTHTTPIVDQPAPTAPTAPPAKQEPAPAQAPTPTTPTDHAQAAQGRVSSYEQSSTGFGGPLTIQRYSNGEQVNAFFGEHTELKCWYTGGGAPTSFEICTKDHLIAGTEVADAHFELSSTGSRVWTYLYLIVPR